MPILIHCLIKNLFSDAIGRSLESGMKCASPLKMSTLKIIWRERSTGAVEARDIIDDTRARTRNYDSARTIRTRIERESNSKPDISPRKFAPDVASRCIEMKISEGKARSRDLIGCNANYVDDIRARFLQESERFVVFFFFSFFN